MAKALLYDSAAKNKILAGVEKLEKAVSATLGPGGRNVIIDEYGSIHSTRDGVTVAKAITLKDQFENLGSNAIKEVAEKSNDRCGDGTTTSTVLAASIYKNGLKYVSLGSNSTQVKNGINKAAKHVIEYVKSIAKPISSKEDIERVATVSANHDTEIGSIIAEVMDKIGKDGTIKIEDGNTMELYSKIVEGMVIDQSFVSPYMITNAETNEAQLENPFVLIANKKLANIQELLPCLEGVTQTGASLLIIADEIQDDILSTLVVNKLRGFNCVAIKSPSYGDNRKAILEDIAILCGGRVVSDETGTRLENATVNSGILGRATRVVVNKDNTVIMGGAGLTEDVEMRAQSLRLQIDATTETYDKEKLQERLAKLTSGIGIISVGASTDAERKEKRDRVDDAFAASKAAVRSGIVPGGGIALLKAQDDLKKWIETESFIGDEVVGANILCESLRMPFNKIIENAGQNPDVIRRAMDDAEHAYSQKGETLENCGYNVVKKTFVNMVEDGIIDPAEVVINEVQNASSVSGLLLTTDCLIVEMPDDKTSATPSACPPGGCSSGMPMM
jgi:chaperonin GroEL